MQRARRRALALCAVLSVSAVACGDGGGVDARSMFALPQSWTLLADTSFFDHPWPSDLRLEGNHPRFAGYYNPNGVPIYEEYIHTVEPLLDGFSPAAAGYLRFDGGIDETTLPSTPAAALSVVSSVQLIDVDPSSPEHGERRAVAVEWHGEVGVYWQAGTLAFMPAPGFPLRPRTRYALVVTDRLGGADGGRVAASDELLQALGVDEPETERAAEVAAAYAPVVDELIAAGVARRNIVHLTAFTTNDPTEELYAVRDAVQAAVPSPQFHADAWIRSKPSKAGWTEYRGVYGPSPNFQEGKLPFTVAGDGGAFAFTGRTPTLVDSFDPRFSLVLPDAASCPMPEAGYPIVLYAHGTGGDYRSFIHDGTATSLASQCLASMGIDQIFHGTRPGGDGDPELLFFNFQNVTAGRTNGRQAAIDEVQRARLFTETRATIPAAVALGGSEVRFDAARVMFFGHSQGGLNGPLLLAADPQLRGAVLSGSSSLLSITLLEKTKPSPSVAALVRSVFLGLDEEQGKELTIFHPAISLAQSLVDVTDPIHYAPHIAREPRPGFLAKSVYMTEGVNADGTGDSYAPPHGIEAQAVAIGLPVQRPSQRALPQSSWGGPGTVQVPVGGLSRNIGAGTASGVLAQWPVPANSDGHFVVFDVPQATAQAASFLRALADDPAGRVPAP
ncbi:MAG: hypothetical protein WKG00_21070 [Polyangiaceae bacterium]